MELSQLLEPLRAIEDGRPFPFEAMAQAVARREEITPVLLACLDHVYDNAENLAQTENPDCLHLYAMFLLAQFREPQAFPKLIRLLTLPSHWLDFLIGDSLTEDYPKFLYSTYDGQISLICEIIKTKN